ncbi:MAG: hypothetical protein C0176_08560 [Mesoaciditoga sp.]|uniref:hypothetical protein n=1 Tax=Athalassotoga sp. TaxID=2022597 RepID=UPI000CC2C555|nr:MAG: hypothetical protein C0176_08560 [Mesoaciditoga sp.]HEU24763.1 hypothetical protein [Mesoaciditoga lauensis]
MNRKLAIAIIFATIIAVGAIDIFEFLSFSGSLNKVVGSIAKFQTLYTQNNEITKQINQYGKMLNSQKITINGFKNALLKISPDANLKISGDTVTLQNPVSVDPYDLVNLLSSYTNIYVLNLYFESNSPVSYEYESKILSSKKNYTLTKMSVRIYGG